MAHHTRALMPQYPFVSSAIDVVRRLPNGYANAWVVDLRSETSQSRDRHLKECSMVEGNTGWPSQQTVISAGPLTTHLGVVPTTRRPISRGVLPWL
jgi:hypothetical protein